MTDEIDDLIRAAAKAHEDLAPPDHFDGLSARVMARIAEVPMMSETNKDAPRGATPPPVGDTPERTERSERNEDSGLHDVKSLAQTTKQRISRRITSQHDAYEESLLSSSQSGLRAVALPAPAQVVSLPAMPASTPGAAEIAGADAAGITPIEAARGSKPKALWLVVGGGVLAAAAAAVFVIASGGEKKDEQSLAAAGAASGSDPMLKEAAGAPPAGGGEAIAQGAGAGTSAGTDTTVVALDPTASPAPPAEAVATGAAAEEPADEVDRPDDDGKSAPAKVEARERGASRAGSSTGAGDKASGKGKQDPKAGGKASAGGGGGAAPAPKGGVGGDSMEELLAAASGGAQKPTQGADTGEKKPEKTSLDGKDIRSGMGAVAKKAQACYDEHGVAGHVKIKATVDPSGKVTKVEAQGAFAGTPTGSCVAAAAKSASFPEWSGAPMTISYGFTLTE